VARDTGGGSGGTLVAGVVSARIALASRKRTIPALLFRGAADLHICKTELVEYP
jgi:hypothetical protein